MTLIEFLRARLDDDEAAARAADPEWKTAHTRYHLAGLDDEPAGHIARHDPARVLAEVEAKRTLVALAETAAEMRDERPDNYAIRGSASAYGTALKHLATAHADHPDYDRSWKPN